MEDAYRELRRQVELDMVRRPKSGRILRRRDGLGEVLDFERTVHTGIRLMSSTRQLELLEADARYYRERISLLRAKQYGRGLGSSARLRELERELERAEQRLRQAQKEPPGAA